ncbi:putative ribonuclease H-like domain-containing protein [Tanacetum coccineum]
MDLFGPVSIESINKKRYCLVVTDDFSRFSWVFFLATKDETSEILCKFIIGLENQLNHNVKIIRCDNGTEFKNHAMNEFCAKKGIKREFSVARTPQQNGVAERKNRTLIEAARTMLADSLLPIPFWAEAVNTACYVLNRILVTNPQNKTPYELLIGNSPSISFMRPFGCPLTILNTLDSLGKFDGKSDEGYLLGYSTTSKAFRVYNKRTKRVEENLHINFLEDQPNVTGTGPNWMFDLDFLTNSMNYIPVSVENQVNVDAVQDVAPTAHEKPSVQDSKDVADKEGKHQMIEDEQVLHDDLEKIIAQEVVATALDDATRQAFKEEKRNIASQKRAAQTTSITKLSTGRSSVSTATTPYVSAASTSTGANAGESSFVYLGGKIPIDASTLPNADLPIDPNMPDLEYDSDAFSSDGIFNGAFDDENVGAVADFNNMDDTINEEGIDYDEVFASVSKIEAIRLFLAFASYIGFTIYQMDVKSAFLYGTIEEEVYVYQPPGFVDLAHPNKVYKKMVSGEKSMCTEFEDYMHKRFQMRSMGELTFFLGLQVKQQPDGIFISQDKYVADILKKFDFWSIRTATTSIKSNKPLVKDEDGEDVDVHIYRSMIGSLMYLTASRSGIMFAVCACARSFSDSDYGGASLDRKSTTCGCQFLSRRLISWQCKKQTIVANSTTKAEYVTAANCCGQVLWIQNQLMDYGFNFMNTNIHIDNESTISVIKNPVVYSRIKHIEIRFHFIRDCYEKRLIEVIKIHTDHNVTDLLTKGFDVTRFNFLVVSIGMLNL